MAAKTPTLAPSSYTITEQMRTVINREAGIEVVTADDVGLYLRRSVEGDGEIVIDPPSAFYYTEPARYNFIKSINATGVLSKLHFGPDQCQPPVRLPHVCYGPPQKTGQIAAPIATLIIGALFGFEEVVGTKPTAAEVTKAHALRKEMGL